MAEEAGEGVLHDVLSRGTVADEDDGQADHLGTPPDRFAYPVK
jgi:hypothetical protein